MYKSSYLESPKPRKHPPRLNELDIDREEFRAKQEEEPVRISLFTGNEVGRAIFKVKCLFLLLFSQLSYHWHIYSANHGISFIRYLWRTYSKRAVLFIKTYEHHNKVVRRSWRC